MVEFIKEIVSGKKRRFRDGGYNLDLTYVTDRIIGMSFPSAGFESMYRNNIDDVSKLLGSRHKSNYLVVNLSGRKYNYEKFHKNVQDFAWEDHHSPPLELLFQACQCIHDFLNKDPKNVAVIHCVAGKGRTGTVISCYLLYSGRFNDSEEALKYYKLKRFQKGGGVTQPSQLRYVRYFWTILRGYLQNQTILSASAVHIDKMIIYGTPRISTSYFRPYVEIYTVRDKVLQYSTKGTKKSPPKYIIKENEENSIAEIQFFESKPLILAGDILIKVYHMGTLNSSLVFRFGFNTTFLQRDADNKSILTLKIQELDPDTTQNDERFPLDFKVELFLRHLERPGEPKTPSDMNIEECYQKEEPHWQAIYQILQKYKRPQPKEGSLYLFNDYKKDDVEEILTGKKIPVREEIHLNEPTSDPESDKSDNHEDIKSDGSQTYHREENHLSDKEDA